MTMHLMVGLPAAGKTTAARRIAAATGALRFTTDEWMIPLFGMSNPADKRDVVEGRLLTLAFDAAGHGVETVVDFGFWGRDERFSLLAIAASVGMAAEVVYLPVDSQTQAGRIGARWSTVPHQTFDITADDLVAYRAIFQEPDASELAGRFPPAPADGSASWADWAEARWPSLIAPRPST